MLKPIVVLYNSPMDMEHIGPEIGKLLRAKDRDVTEGRIGWTEFGDREAKCEIPVSVREAKVYLLHSMFHSEPEKSFFRLLQTLNALSLASCRDVTVVAPYMTFMRQDSKDKGREPITAAMVADILRTRPSFRRLITMELHSRQAQGFFGDRPVDHLEGRLILAPYFRSVLRKQYGNEFHKMVLVVSPDEGGVKRARKFAKQLHPSTPVHFMAKERGDCPNDVERLSFGGKPEDVKGKMIIVYDDLMDSGKTTTKAGEALSELNPVVVYAAAAHAVFSKVDGVTAEERFEKSGMHVVTTNSIPRDPIWESINKNWLTVLSAMELLADAIHETSRPGGSVSALFDKYK